MMSLSAHALTDIAPELDERYPDTWLSALADERRRTLLSELQTLDAPIDVDELARRVAVAETGRPSDTLSEDQVRNVRISIHHNHLPRLTDVGLVDVDRTGHTIESVTFRGDIPRLKA